MAPLTMALLAVELLTMALLTMAPGHDARDVVLLCARLTKHVMVQVGGDVLGVDDAHESLS